MNGTYQPIVYTEVNLLAKQTYHKETRLQYTKFPVVYFRVIRIACGQFMNRILIEHKMCYRKQAKFIFQQHDNAQYRITTKSVKQFMGHWALQKVGLVIGQYG
jgi:hypothetical protein